MPEAPSRRKAASPKIDPQQSIDEVAIEHEELLLALNVREESKAAAAQFRKAGDSVRTIVAEDLAEHAGKLIRVGQFTFEILDDPGGNEVQGYVTTGGIKPRRIRREEG